MHVGFLLTNGVKMSKSLGNSILAKDVLQRHSGNAIRLFFQTTHYRAPVNYTEENLNAYFSSLRKAFNVLSINHIPDGNLLQDKYEAFMDALTDDLNVANAMTVFDFLIKEVNTLTMKKDADLNHLSDLFATLTKFAYILGLSYEFSPLSEEDIALLGEYNKARENKDFKKSDELRPALMEKGLL